MNTSEFKRLMEQLARAWSQQDTEAALACFTPHAEYTEPPDIQFYLGHEQLRPYFAALKPGTFMHFHHIWFDEAKQAGAGEYSFGLTGKPTADHGVAVVELRNRQLPSGVSISARDLRRFPTSLPLQIKHGSGISAIIHEGPGTWVARSGERPAKIQRKVCGKS